MKTIKTNNFKIRIAQSTPNFPENMGKKKQHGGGFLSNVRKTLAPAAGETKDFMMGDKSTGRRGMLGKMFEGSLIGDAVNIVSNEFGLGSKNNLSNFQRFLSSTKFSDQIEDEYLKAYLRKDYRGAIDGLSAKFKLEKRDISNSLKWWIKERTEYFEALSGSPAAPTAPTAPTTPTTP